MRTMGPIEQDCFVIAPIGDENSEIRRRSDQVFKHIINPAVQASGFKATRADHISEPGLITTQVIQRIIHDPLVVADLTGSEANVFYELAVRHAVRRPLIQIIQRDEKLPFDVAGIRTINVDHRDLDSVDEAKNAIKKQISQIFAGERRDTESPISISIELFALRNSEKPEERSLADLLSEIVQLRSDLSSLEKRMSNRDISIAASDIERLGDVISRRAMLNLEQLESSNRERYREREAINSEIVHRIRQVADTLEGKQTGPEVIEALRQLREAALMLNRNFGLLS
jgi:hypothetical protein